MDSMKKAIFVTFNLKVGCCLGGVSVKEPFLLNPFKEVFVDRRGENCETGKKLQHESLCIGVNLTSPLYHF